MQLPVASMSHADKFQFHIHSALAEQEREFISIRTKTVLAEAKVLRAKLGGARDKTLKRNAAVQAVAQEKALKVAGIIQSLRHAGKSLRQIADELNRAGVATAGGGLAGLSGEADD